MKVTNELLDRARLLGACSEVPSVGDDVLSLTQYMAVWAEEHDLFTAQELHELCDDPRVSRGRVQLTLLPKYGYCCCSEASWYMLRTGAGDGTGEGYGIQLDSGHGYGYGLQHGYATSAGSGLGYGDSYGFGHNDGWGYGEEMLEVEDDEC